MIIDFSFVKTLMNQAIRVRIIPTRYKPEI